MDIIKIVGIGIIGTVIVSLLRTAKAEIAVFASIGVGAVILITVVSGLSEVVEVFDNIVNRTGLDHDLFSGVLKIIGIGYVVEYTANICTDAGNCAIATKLMLAGKRAVFLMALPIISKVVELVLEILP